MITNINFHKRKMCSNVEKKIAVGKKKDSLKPNVQICITYIVTLLHCMYETHEIFKNRR